MRLHTLILMTALLIAAPVSARPLYVNAATGSDTTTYAANSEATPWRSIGRAAWGSTNRSAPNAAQAAKAGDVVLIAVGTYTTQGASTGGGGGRWEIAYNPANEGTAAAPIRFACAVAPQCVLTYSGGRGPMIGANNRDHIVWSGFSISEATATTEEDSAPVVFFGSDPRANYVQGGGLEDSVLTGPGRWVAREGNNYSGVRLEYTNGQRIANNMIRGYGSAAGDHNHSGITTYKWEDLTVEHNLFEGAGSGIFLKATQTVTREVGRTVIRNNRFTGTKYDVHVHRAPNTDAEPILITQNLFLGSRVGVRILKFGDATDPRAVKMISNTFDGNSEAALVIGSFSSINADASYLWQNNLVTGGRIVSIQHPASSLVPSAFTATRNWYGPTGTFADVGAATTSFAQWQALGLDANSVNGQAPGYVSATDYRLVPASPARTAGRVHSAYPIGGAAGDVIPVGAYITGEEVIGPGGATPTPTPVDCVVSAPVLTAFTPWGACVAGTQTRSETWTRTVVTPPAHGGAACPALTETRTGSQSCTVAPTPVDCVGTWGDWTRQQGSETACVNGQRSFLQARLFTVITSPAHGGLACPASPEMRTTQESCSTPTTPTIRLDCEHIERIDPTSPAGGFDRWIIRGRGCVILPAAGAVRGPGQ